LASQTQYISLGHFGMYAGSRLQNYFVTDYPKHGKRKLNRYKKRYAVYLS